METRRIQSKEKSLICEFCQNNFTCTSALYRHQRTTKKCISIREHENLLKVRQQIEERKELERKTLESIKDELEILSDLHHKATGMCFNSYGEVVGKYCWNLEGYHDYSELTVEDKKLCANKNFKILERC